MLNWDSFSDKKSHPENAQTSPEAGGVPATQHVAAESNEVPTFVEENPVSQETNESELNEGLEPVRVDDKRVVNGLSDVNQLAPFKYPWAWE